MKIKKFLKYLFILILLTLSFYFFYKKLTINKKTNLNDHEKDINYNSNIIQNVEYMTKDDQGNEYYIKASEGQIDFSNPGVIYLTGVNAEIKLNNSEILNIFSNYGKYNSENFDTIFTKNVIITYLDNKITSEYLDFSLEKNSLFISKNVVYRNQNNTLKADVFVMDIKTKDSKIYMYDNNKKVQIDSKN